VAAPGITPESLLYVKQRNPGRTLIGPFMSCTHPGSSSGGGAGGVCPEGWQLSFEIPDESRQWVFPKLWEELASRIPNAHPPLLASLPACRVLVD
jgi:hypothetical protein